MSYKATIYIKNCIYREEKREENKDINAYALATKYLGTQQQQQQKTIKTFFS